MRNIKTLKKKLSVAQRISEVQLADIFAFLDKKNKGGTSLYTSIPSMLENFNYLDRGEASNILTIYMNVIETE